jgi:hypothetical protein
MVNQQLSVSCFNTDVTIYSTTLRRSGLLQNIFKVIKNKVALEWEKLPARL